jgi:beta-phosphoglucomutase
MLSAVIFDFDGVIVDTEPLHYRAMQEVLEPIGLGYTWQDYVSHFIGFDDRDAIRERYKLSGREVFDKELQDLVQAKADAFERLVVEEGADPYPGAVALIKSLSGEIPLGLCSGALRRDIDPILKDLGVARCFNAIVTAEEVTTSKPDPECYRLTIKRLASFAPGQSLEASDAIAIEDTPAGISAAKDAGLKVLALPNSHDPTRLHGADIYTDSLERVSLEWLRLKMS